MDINERAAPQERWAEHIEIREVGTPANGAGSPTGNDSPTETRTSPRLRDRPFLGAWALTGLLLAIGIAWLSGAFENSRYTTTAYGSVISVNPSTGEMISPETLEPAWWSVPMQNIAQVAPLILLIGTLSACGLLAIQGIQRSLVPRAPRPSAPIQT